MERVLVLWMEDQTSHNIPASKSLIQSKALSLFISVKASRGEAAAEEKSELGRVWFMACKLRSHLHNMKVRGEAAGADGSYVSTSPRRSGCGSSWRWLHYGTDCQCRPNTLHQERMPSRTSRSSRGVSASLQSFQGPADSLVRGQVSWWLEVEANAHLPFRKS